MLNNDPEFEAIYNKLKDEPCTCQRNFAACASLNGRMCAFDRLFKMRQKYEASTDQFCIVTKVHHLKYFNRTDNLIRGVDRFGADKFYLTEKCPVEEIQVDGEGEVCIDKQRITVSGLLEQFYYDEREKTIFIKFKPCGMMSFLKYVIVPSMLLSCIKAASKESTIRISCSEIMTPGLLQLISIPSSPYVTSSNLRLEFIQEEKEGTSSNPIRVDFTLERKSSFVPILRSTIKAGSAPKRSNAIMLMGIKTNSDLRTIMETCAVDQEVAKSAYLKAAGSLEKAIDSLLEENNMMDYLQSPPNDSEEQKELPSSSSSSTSIHPPTVFSFGNQSNNSKPATQTSLPPLSPPPPPPAHLNIRSPWAKPPPEFLAGYTGMNPFAPRSSPIAFSPRSPSSAELANGSSTLLQPGNIYSAPTRSERPPLFLASSTIDPLAILPVRQEDSDEIERRLQNQYRAFDRAQQSLFSMFGFNPSQSLEDHKQSTPSASSVPPTTSYLPENAEKTLQKCEEEEDDNEDGQRKSKNNKSLPCNFCMEYEVRLMSNPCNHLSYCYNCARETQSKKQCFICRQKITHFTIVNIS